MADGAAGTDSSVWAPLLRASPELRHPFVAHSISRAGDAFDTVALVLLLLAVLEDHNEDAEAFRRTSRHIVVTATRR